MSLFSQLELLRLQYITHFSLPFLPGSSTDNTHSLFLRIGQQWSHMAEAGKFGWIKHRAKESSSLDIHTRRITALENIPAEMDVNIHDPKMDHTSPFGDCLACLLISVSIYLQETVGTSLGIF